MIIELQLLHQTSSSLTFIHHIASPKTKSKMRINKSLESYRRCRYSFNNWFLLHEKLNVNARHVRRCRAIAISIWNLILIEHRYPISIASLYQYQRRSICKEFEKRIRMETHNIYARVIDFIHWSSHMMDLVLIFHLCICLERMLLRRRHHPTASNIWLTNGWLIQDQRDWNENYTLGRWSMAISPSLIHDTTRIPYIPPNSLFLFCRIKCWKFFGWTPNHMPIVAFYSLMNTKLFNFLLALFSYFI